MFKLSESEVACLCQLKQTKALYRMAEFGQWISPALPDTQFRGETLTRLSMKCFVKFTEFDIDNRPFRAVLTPMGRKILA